ncbi:MFS transporter [Streptomyces sp. NPDC048210]|uniref:MFS transporter n=1 Tax=Streptomyces sp. NPDC048210 TaxID=3156657 RepID=UPI003438B217
MTSSSPSGFATGEATKKPAKKTRVRFAVLALILIISTVSQGDRAILSITGPAIQQDLGIGGVALGYLFSAFAWSYLLGQIPGGWLLDRLGTRFVYGGALAIWSTMTLLQAFVPLLGVGTAIVALFTLRLAVGLAEAPGYPANSRAVASWFPQTERGTASSIFASSAYAAPVFVTPLMAWLTHQHGWPSAYMVMGVLGLLLSLVWLWFYRPPAAHPRANQAEVDHIADGHGLIHETKSDPGQAVSPKVCLKALLTSRLMVCVYIGQFFIQTLVYFFLTWFPIYLVQGLGMSLLDAGFTAAMPALLGLLGGLTGGMFSDWLIRRGLSLTLARKIPIVTGLLMSCFILACVGATSKTFVIVMMAIAFFGKGFGSLGWVIVADTSPREATGLAGGLFNMIGNISGITTPIAIGYLVDATGSFDSALLLVGVSGALAATAFIAAGTIKRMELSPRGGVAENASTAPTA